MKAISTMKWMDLIISVFVLLCMGCAKKEREAKALELLELFKLKDAGKRPFKAYSKGMRRKLTIAAALIHSPPQVLFLDEPTTGIDVESSRQIREMIVDLKSKELPYFSLPIILKKLNVYVTVLLL